MKNEKEKKKFPHLIAILNLFLLTVFIGCKCKIPVQYFSQADLKVIPYKDDDAIVLYDSLGNAYDFGKGKWENYIHTTDLDDESSYLFSSKCKGRQSIELREYNSSDDSGLLIELNLFWKGIGGSAYEAYSSTPMMSIGLHLDTFWFSTVLITLNNGDFTFTTNENNYWRYWRFVNNITIGSIKYDSVYIFNNTKSGSDSTTKVLYTKSKGIIGVETKGFKAYIK